MPTHEVLTPAQREGLLALPDNLPYDEVQRLYTLGPEILTATRQRRGAANRLGFALQWAYLRYAGRPWQPDDAPPAAVLWYLAAQVGVPVEALTGYGRDRENTRLEHLRLLLQLVGCRSFEAPERELAAWLRSAARATDHGLRLVEGLIEHLRAERIVMPALSTIEALVWQARHEARGEAERSLSRTLSAVHTARLEALLLSDPEHAAHGAVLTWLRQVQGKPSAATLLQYLHRLHYLQGLGLPDALREVVHPHRLRLLAREGSRYTPQHLSRLRPARRRAILASFVVETIAHYTDQALLLHDRLIGALLHRAERRHEQVFYRRGRAINGKLRTFARVGRVTVAFARVNAGLDADLLEGVRIERRRPVVSPLPAATPPEAKAQARRAYDLFPAIKITDLLVEVDLWTGFTHKLSALRGGTSSRDREALFAALLAEATNLGLVKMAEATPGLSYGRLASAVAEHLRDETYEAALAELVNAQHRQPLAALWGDGTTASSDGQRFPVGGRREPSAQVNARYGSGPSVLFCTHLSDRYAPFHTKVINAGARDATHVLDGLLEHESELEIEEHYTDTAGYTEQVFGLCCLLGFRFAPRIRGLSHKKLFTLGPTSVLRSTPLASLLGERINEARLVANWDEVLRLAASIRQGTVSASMMLAKLAAYPRQNQLAVAVRDLGRIERTLFTFDWLSSPEQRRRVNHGLCKGEERNALARAVFFHRRGMVQEPRAEAMMQRAGALNLVVAAITLWNTVHLTRAVQRLADQQAPIPDYCLPHVSPLVWDHIQLTGEYRWSLIG